MVWLESIRLRSGSPQTRRKAIESLTAAGKLPGLKLLIASLGDPDPQVRCAAAKALGTINEEFSVAARVAALADVSSEVRATAATTLRASPGPAADSAPAEKRARRRADGPPGGDCCSGSGTESVGDGDVAQQPG